MNLLKQYKKLACLNIRAEECKSREEAKKILRKANKVNNKVGYNRWKNLTS